MKILVIGATGTIGAAVSQNLAERHEVIRASRSRAPLQIDLANPQSIKQLFKRVGLIDAVVCAAGHAAFRAFIELSDADYVLSLGNKLMGQVNLVRHGLDAVSDGGSFTLTGGIMARRPMTGGAAISMVNSALEGFARGAAIELPRKIRINVVAPPWVTETLVAFKMDPSIGTPAAVVAETYRKAVEGRMTGQVLDAG